MQTYFVYEQKVCTVASTTIVAAANVVLLFIPIGVKLQRLFSLENKNYFIFHWYKLKIFMLTVNHTQKKKTKII